MAGGYGPFRAAATSRRMSLSKRASLSSGRVYGLRVWADIFGWRRRGREPMGSLGAVHVSADQVRPGCAKLGKQWPRAATIATEPGSISTDLPGFGPIRGQVDRSCHECGPTPNHFLSSSSQVRPKKKLPIRPNSPQLWSYPARLRDSSRPYWLMTSLAPSRKRDRTNQAIKPSVALSPLETRTCMVCLGVRSHRKATACSS